MRAVEDTVHGKLKSTLLTGLLDMYPRQSNNRRLACRPLHPTQDLLHTPSDNSMIGKLSTHKTVLLERTADALRRSSNYSFR